MLDTSIKFEPVFGGITLPSGDKDSEKPPDSDDWKKAKKVGCIFERFLPFNSSNIWLSLRDK